MQNVSIQQTIAFVCTPTYSTLEIYKADINFFEVLELFSIFAIVNVEVICEYIVFGHTYRDFVKYRRYICEFSLMSVCCSFVINTLPIQKSNRFNWHT